MPYSDPARQREYMRQWYADRRAAWFADKACVRCGSTQNLTLDHVDRATKVDHRVFSWSQQRRDAELAKCQVLCWPCHLIKTDESGDNPTKANGFRHGTRSMYERHRCRCDDCKEWKRAKNARRYLPR